eukprot:scaffold2475_cov245-Pinguiococcus_pyrenoidosus.AAC.1
MVIDHGISICRDRSYDRSYDRSRRPDGGVLAMVCRFGLRSAHNPVKSRTRLLGGKQEQLTKAVE